MSQSATPTKRVLTEDAHNALVAPCSPRANVVSDDLTLCLQNLGSRVRKSVSEGYATQRFESSPSVTPTPFSSPVKSTAVSTPSQGRAIFRSATDTLIDVYSSRVRAAELLHPPSPSPRKRGHAEVDSPDEDGSCSPVTMKNGTPIATEMQAASDDGDIMIIIDSNPSQSPSRPIKPLKKRAGTRHAPRPASNTSSASRPSPDPSGADVGTDGAVSAAWKDMFNQPF